MKINIKKIFSLFIVLISACLFCGCATADYSLTINSSGVITENLKINLDQSALEDAGYSSNDVIAQIKNKTVTTYSPLINTFTNASLFRIKSSSNTPTTYQISVAQMVGVYSHTVVVLLLEYSSTQITCSLNFSSPNIYYEFYGVSEEELAQMEEDNNIVENFLFKKTTQTGNTAFNNLAHSSLTTYFLNYFHNGENQIFDLDDISFSHSYATYNTGLKSNADYVYYKDGMKYHVWNINSTNTDRVTEFYTVQINYIYWYVIAIGLSLVFISILYIVDKIKKTKKETNTPK